MPPARGHTPMSARPGSAYGLRDPTQRKGCIYVVSVGRVIDCTIASRKPSPPSPALRGIQPKSATPRRTRSHPKRVTFEESGQSQSPVAQSSSPKSSTTRNTRGGTSRRGRGPVAPSRERSNANGRARARGGSGIRKPATSRATAKSCKRVAAASPTSDTPPAETPNDDDTTQDVEEEEGEIDNGVDGGKEHDSPSESPSEGEDEVQPPETVAITNLDDDNKGDNRKVKPCNQEDPFDNADDLFAPINPIPPPENRRLIIPVKLDFNFTGTAGLKLGSNVYSPEFESISLSYDLECWFHQQVIKEQSRQKFERALIPLSSICH